MKSHSWLFALPALLLLLLPISAHADGQTAVRQTVQMLDYLGRDYAGAVQDGKVVSEFEYNEQIEFAKIVQRNAQDVPELAADQALQGQIEALITAIDQKAAANEITKLTSALRKQVIAATNLPMAPSAAPNLQAGAEIFAQQCAACHGAQGAGDGAAGAGMEPAPANFLDGGLMTDLTPFQAFNTTRNGVQGTGMPAFGELTDEQIWDTAFYLFALRHAGREDELGKVLTAYEGAVPTLEKLATQSESSLVQDLSGPPAQRETVMAALRLFPAEQDPLELAVALLDQSKAAFAAGNFDDAEQLALAAYLEGVEPVEAVLAARDAAIVPQIEQAMQRVRSAVQPDGNADRVDAAIASAKQTLNEASGLLKNQKMSFWTAFGASLVIMLREGFEAVLIVVSLFAVLRRLKATKAQHWTHLGWVSALVAGVATWYVSEGILAISGAQREIMEGFVALAAVGILIYMGFWLHSQAEIQKWAAFVNLKARQAVAEKRFYTFFGISFLAVYREAFETVLFYRALSLDVSSEAQGALALGLGVGIVGIAILAFGMLRFGARIPLKRFFQASAALLFALTVVLLGKGIHALQEAGWLSVSSLPVNLRIDLLGVYPTYEVLIPQIVLIVALVLLNMRLRSQTPNRRQAASA